uniref:hypothetical protein n=1 Tax=Alistipes sp. TaxID=1872444 RepID=UPI0040560EEB
MKKIILITLLSFATIYSYGQGARLIHGCVFGKDRLPLQGAIISDMQGKQICISNASGSFSATTIINVVKIQISCDGYNSQTIDVDGSYLIVNLNKRSSKSEKEKALIAAQKEAEEKAKIEEKALIAAQKEAEEKAKIEEKARIAAQKDAEEKAKIEEKARIAAQKKIEANEKKIARKEKSENRKGRFFCSFNLAMPYMKYPDALSYGFMAGWGSKKLLGGYVKGVFGDGISRYIYGTINSQSSCLGNSSPKSEASYSAVTGGLLFRMGCPLHLYTGVGTSWRKVAHKDAIDSGWYLSADKSTTTFCIDFGLMLKFKWFNISGGAIYTPKYGFASNMGIGICF